MLILPIRILSVLFDTIGRSIGGWWLALLYMCCSRGVKSIGFFECVRGYTDRRKILRGGGGGDDYDHVVGLRGSWLVDVSSVKAIVAFSQGKLFALDVFTALYSALFLDETYSIGMIRGIILVFRVFVFFVCF